jgi:hypothetical protein
MMVSWQSDTAVSTMDESRFLSLMMKARTFSSLGERPDYWHGYQRGLRRGFLGELFGTGEEHERWMRLADDGVDNAARERGRGYRDGLRACGADVDEGSALAGSVIRNSKLFGPAKGGNSRP